MSAAERIAAFGAALEALGAASIHVRIEAEQRASVVDEVRRWRGTPYHDQGDVRGFGVDCGMLLVRTFVDTGLVLPFDPRPYPSDWMLHRDEERYLAIVRRFCDFEWDPRETAPLPGDVVVWRHGRTYSHGAVVTAWPFVVHAFAGARLVEEIDVTGSPMMRQAGGGPRPIRAFSLWRNPAEPR
jgi:cell wall-associated NlpC family hydrolase